MRWGLAMIAALGMGCTMLVDAEGLSGDPASSAGTSDASTTSSDGSTSTADGSEGGARPDGGMTDGGGPELVDLFDRPDGVVGNGWLENEPDVFALVGGRVTAKSGNWTTRYIYRPSEEDVLDVESSVELRWQSTPPENCDPSITLRIQRANGKTSGYAAFIDDRDSLAISRIDDNAEVFLGYKEMSEPVNTKDNYRLTFRITGTDPVLMVTKFEKSAASGWVTLATHSLTDDTNKRVKAAGSVGLNSDQHATFSYDVFTRMKL